MSDPRSAPGQGYGGVYLGTVRSVDDPDDLGRVRLDTDQYDDTEQDAVWAPVGRPLAGSASSVFFTPKEGDQVVFAFLAGDVRQPIVLGYVHAGDRAPEAVGQRKHSIRVDGVGAITFSEDDGSIVIEQGDPARATIKLAGGRIEIDASSMTFKGDSFVLGEFFTRFTAHTHVASGGGAPTDPPTLVPPVLEGPPYSTST